MRQFIIAHLFFSLLISASSWGSIFGETTALPADQAIQFSSSLTDDALMVEFELADNIYLYKDKIKLSFSDKSPYLHHSFLEKAETIDDPSFGKVAVFYHSATLKIDRTQLPAGTESLTLRYQGCDEAIGLCYPPQKAQLNISPASISSQASSETQLNLDNASQINGFLNQASLWLVIATFLLLGIGLTFTPCVLPMVPILSSVIAGQDNVTAKKGFILSVTYVLGMALTFAVAGTIVGLLGARFNLQIYMQQPWILGLFAVLFVLLALSMFGLYELKLPRFIQEPLDRLNHKQKGGSLVSVFFMGALSAVVVSPCVSAPLAGALVYISTTGDAILGGGALFALGLGMGLPLIIIGTSGASLLPKAGVWMEQVKVLFGVLLLAVALWILGRVLPEAVYLISWSLLLGCYAAVLGAFEAAVTAKQRLIKGVALLMFALATIFIFKVVMATENLNTEALTSQTASEPTSISNVNDDYFKRIYTKDVFESTLQSAKENNKLVFVDVYADWCIECKIMENNLFKDPEVRSALNDFVRIKLDITAFDEFHKSFLESQQVFGPPSLLFYGYDGNSIDDAKILGEINKADFLNHLEQFDP